MGKSFLNLSKSEKKFLISLLDDGSKTDVQISQETGLSKSSTHRIRKKLEKSKIISEYIPIVDLDKIGVNVFFVIVFEWNNFKDEELTKKVFTELENDPHVIFLANGEGSNGITNVMFVGFRDVDSYNLYFKEFRKNYGEFINKINWLMVPGKEIKKNDFTEMVRHALKN